MASFILAIAIIVWIIIVGLLRIPFDALYDKGLISKALLELFVWICYILSAVIMFLIFARKELREYFEERKRIKKWEEEHKDEKHTQARRT